MNHSKESSAAWVRSKRASGDRAGVDFAILLSGCSIARTVTVDRTGRDAAKVDADILACWQDAEAMNPPTGKFVATGLLLGVFAQTIDSYNEEIRVRQERVQSTAEACMEKRGYTVTR